jgi:hypothetical protein
MISADDIRKDFFSLISQPKENTIEESKNDTKMNVPEGSFIDLFQQVEERRTTQVSLEEGQKKDIRNCLLEKVDMSIIEDFNL